MNHSMKENQPYNTHDGTWDIYNAEQRSGDPKSDPFR